MKKGLNRWARQALAGAALLGSMALAHASPLVLSLTGIESMGEAGDPGNTVLTVDVAAGAVVDLISWDLTLQTFGASWLSEATILLRNSNGDGVAFNPGFGDDDAGSASYSGSMSLAGAGLSFSVLSDGKLFIEFYDSFDDNPGAADALYGGTLTVAGVLPEPASALLLGLALMGLCATRRRRI